MGSSIDKGNFGIYEEMTIMSECARALRIVVLKRINVGPLSL